MKKYALPHLFLVLTLLNFEQTQAQVTNTITNAYGPATIGSGTTSLITNGATIAGLITNNGQLLFFQSSAITNAFVVSGTGTLAQAGTGTTILTASNTYSKGTTISSGTLQVGDGGTNGTLGTTNVTNNASLVFNRSDTFTVSNTISGSGSLTQAGTGTSILSSTSNSYSGGTFINAGTLLVSGRLGNGTYTGEIVDNSSLTFSNTTASSVHVLSGAITGTGSLTQAGGNTTTLAGSNSYSGGTLISAGSLQIGTNGGNSGTLGSGNVSVNTNTVLIFNRSDTAEFANAISGSGTLLQKGSGTTILSGSNAFTGKTLIGAGVLEFATTNSLYNGVTSSWNGTNIVVSNGATLAFDVGSGAFTTSNITIILSQTTNASSKGFLSGSAIGFDVGGGGFVLTNNLRNSASGALGLLAFGGGTLTVSGSNSNTGTNTIASGTTLQIGTGGTVGSLGSGTIIGNGTLVFNRSDSITFTNLISGGLSVNQAGSGTLTISPSSGANFNTGSTIVSAGTLNVGAGGVNDLTIDTGTNNSTNLIINAGRLNNNNAQFGGMPNTVGTVNVNSGTWSNAGTLFLGYYGTGSATVNDGTVAVNGSLYLGYNSGSVGSLVVNGGTVNIGTGYGTSYVGYVGGSVGSLTINGGTVNAGNGGYGTLSLASSASSLGTLNLGNGGDSAGTLVASMITGGSGTATLNANVSGAVTIGQNLTGSLRLNQLGTGTAILTGSNSYGGITTISAGTLQVGNGDTTGNLGTNSVIDNGTLAFNRSDAFTISNVISGTGSVSQLGTGTTTLSASNSYSGTTTVSAGTLRAGSAVAFGTNPAINVSLGSTLDLNGYNYSIGALSGGGNVSLGSGTMTIGANNSNASFVAGISGTGGLIKNGTGTSVLGGANTFTGFTTISAGTLQVGDGDTNGTLGGGDVTNNAVLALNRADSFTLSNKISGTGSLLQAGTGTSILAGSNNYSGGTTISSGTLQIGDGGTNGTLSGAILNNGTFAFNRSSSLVLSNAISGTGSLLQMGTGTTILAASNTYSGLTTIASGVLSFSNSAAFGSSTLIFASNSTLQSAATQKLTNAQVVSSAVTGTFDVPSSMTLTNMGVISGSGNVAKSAKTNSLLIFTANNTYTGTTTIGAGTLQLGTNGTTGMIGSGSVINSGTLLINRTDSLTLSNAISGTGTLSKTASGTVTLTGNNTYSGYTAVLWGTLRVGDGGTNGTLGSGSISLSGGNLVINHSDNVTISNNINGEGTLVQNGTGTLILATNNSFDGGLVVNAGSVKLMSRAALDPYRFMSGGLSFFAYGPVSVTNGALLDLGGFSHTVMKITLGSGTISNGSLNSYTGSGEALAQEGVISASISAPGLRKKGAGTLVLSGTNNFDGGQLVFENGVVRLETGGTMNVLPNNLSYPEYIIGQSNGQSAQFIVNGGNVNKGTDTNSFYYTNIAVLGDQAGSTGSVIINSGSWTNEYAFYVGKSGTGTLTIVDGRVGVDGNNRYGTTRGTGTVTLASSNSSVGTLNFGTGGSSTGTLAADTVTGGFGAATVNVNNAAPTTLGQKFTGSLAFNQLGTGTTTLTASNSYAGTTTIAAGVLQIGTNGTNGTLGSGSVIDNAALAFNRSDSFMVSNSISGTGILAQVGTGITILSGNNTYSGPTTINSGTLQIGNGGTTGSLGSGDVTDNGILAFNRSDTLPLSNTISGTGSVTHVGTGITILTGNNTYSGPTMINSGTLQVGDGGTTGSLGSGVVTDNGILAFNRSDSITLSNVVSGTGNLVQKGYGTLTLTGNNTYSGTTTITNGTLQVGNGGGSGALGGGNISNDSLLLFNRTGSLTVAGVISGSGTLVKDGAGTVTLAGDNTYSGPTTISAGTLQIGNGGIT